MDAKVTLSFNKQVIEKAKKYAAANNMSLSRLMELILDNLTSKQYPSLENLPISDWVSQVAEGPAEYRPAQKRQSLKTQYRQRKKSR